jgi:UDP-glucose 4-epimerase
MPSIWRQAAISASGGKQGEVGMFEKVVCTGGSGKLGQHVARRLMDKCALTITDLRPPSDVDLGGVPFVAADMTKLDAMRSLFEGQDAVVHLAAIPNPRTAPADVTFGTNVQGAWTVMQAAEDAGVKRVVVASSDSVFGMSYNPPDWPPQFLPIDESHPTRPTEFYSLSKRITESIAESYAARGRLEVLVIRPVHIVFAPEYPELSSRGADVENYHFWAYVAPEDVAQAFELALAAPYDGYDVFTIGAEDGLNSRPTLEMAAERWKPMPDVRKPELFAANPYASVMDISKARHKLGYAPKVRWRDMLEK